MNDAAWKGGPPPDPIRPGMIGWILVAVRGACLAFVVFGGLLLLLLLRLIERPRHGSHRPWTPWITVWVCRVALVILGLRVRHQGTFMSSPGMAAANHSSWLDIFVLNSAGPLYFVSKSEVARWPGIGWLARATGTVFIERDRAQARVQAAEFEARLKVGHRLLLFPEGTSSDGVRVLKFKSTLFAALFSPNVIGLSVQPVTVAYTPPSTLDPRFYGWWGDMDFASHLLQLLAARERGCVDVVWHSPLATSGFEGRKALSDAVEHLVRNAHPSGHIET